VGNARIGVIRGEQMKGKQIMAVKINKEKCTGCGICVDICPVEAISMEDDKAKIDTEKCVDCGQCVEQCPNEAISMP
jgi:NAD-dependent dihydropyrimidine dehydrogenase PreA subunit